MCVSQTLVLCTNAKGDEKTAPRQVALYGVHGVGIPEVDTRQEGGGRKTAYTAIKQAFYRRVQ